MLSQEQKRNSRCRDPRLVEQQLRPNGPQVSHNDHMRRFGVQPSRGEERVRNEVGSRGGEGLQLSVEGDAVCSCASSNDRDL